MELIQHSVVYAALGDSMSIDDYAGGPGCGAASLLWRNRDHDFPAWAGRDLTTRDPAARRAIRTVVNNGRLVLASLRTLMGPEAPIVVATVHDPSDGSGDAGRLGLPPWPEALEFLAELNRALRMLADEHKTLVAEAHARFLGHGLTIGNPAQQAARPPERGMWYCDLIEPTPGVLARSGPPSGRRLSGRTASKRDHLESSSTTAPEQRLAGGRIPPGRPRPPGRGLPGG
jgi:hypothetical protein